VSAGRSHLLIAYPSFYILLDDCQGVVGHWEQDFDTGTHLSSIYLYVTNILICHIFSDPVSAVSPSISLKRVSLSGLTLTHTMGFVFKRLAETAFRFRQVMMYSET